MSDEQTTARILEYLRREGATYDQTALVRKLQEGGYPQADIDEALRRYAAERANAPGGLPRWPFVLGGIMAGPVNIAIATSLTALISGAASATPGAAAFFIGLILTLAICFGEAYGLGLLFRSRAPDAQQIVARSMWLGFAISLGVIGLLFGICLVIIFSL